MWKTQVERCRITSVGKGSEKKFSEEFLFFLKHAVFVLTLFNRIPITDNPFLPNTPQSALHWWRHLCVNCPILSTCSVYWPGFRPGVNGQRKPRPGYARAW